jgi:hypothetical protein
VARMDTMGGSTDSRTASTGAPGSLPWRQKRSEITGAPTLRIETAEGTPIADVTWSHADNGVASLSDAAFIVRAVNSHADLLAALKDMAVRYTALVNCGDCGNWDPETEPQVVAAREAIAKADGSHA